MAARLAAAEGLCLVPAHNEAGYRGVSRQAGTKSFPFNVRKRNMDLGKFASAAEGALAYARYIGASASAKEASQAPRGPKRRADDHAGFGVPVLQQGCETIQAVVCEGSSDDEAICDSTIVVATSAMRNSSKSAAGAACDLPQAPHTPAMHVAGRLKHRRNQVPGGSFRP